MNLNSCWDSYSDKDMYQVEAYLNTNKLSGKTSSVIVHVEKDLLSPFESSANKVLQQLRDITPNM